MHTLQIVEVGESIKTFGSCEGSSVLTQAHAYVSLLWLSDVR
jgi:hypothetical protein